MAGAPNTPMVKLPVTLEQDAGSGEWTVKIWSEGSTEVLHTMEEFSVWEDALATAYEWIAEAVRSEWAFYVPLVRFL